MIIYNCFVSENYKQLQQGLDIFNGWMGVGTPLKKIKKFKIGDGNKELQRKMMAWSFNAQETWCTKRFSQLWIMTSRVSGTCEADVPCFMKLSEMHFGEMLS